MRDPSRSMVRVLILLAAVLIIPLCAAPGFAQIMPGEALPDFVSTDADGSSYSLAGQHGYVVLVFIFGVTDACTGPAETLETDFHDRYSARGLRVLGIDGWDGSADEVAQFRSSTGASFPLLLDGSGFASTCGLPYNSFLVADVNGIVRFVSAGPAETAFDPDELSRVVEAQLDAVNGVSYDTWGRIKKLYGR